MEQATSQFFIDLCIAMLGVFCLELAILFRLTDLKNILQNTLLNSTTLLSKKITEHRLAVDSVFDLWQMAGLDAATHKTPDSMHDSDIKSLIKHLLHCTHATQTATRCAWVFSIAGATIEGDHFMPVLKKGQSATLSLNPKTHSGSSAKVDGIPVWALLLGTAVALTVAEDGLSATIDAIEEGAVQVQVTADADLGEGVSPIVNTMDITVLPEQAEDLGLDFTINA